MEESKRKCGSMFDGRSEPSYRSGYTISGVLLCIL